MAFVNSRDSADMTSLLKAFSQGDEARDRSAEDKRNRAQVFWGLERRGDRGSLTDFSAKRDA